MMTNRIFCGKVINFLLYLLILYFPFQAIPHTYIITITVPIGIIYAIHFRDSSERPLYLVHMVYTLYKCRDCFSLNVKACQLLHYFAEVNTIVFLGHFDIFMIIMKYMFMISLYGHKSTTLPMKALWLLKLRRYILKSPYPLMPKQ